MRETVAKLETQMREAAKKFEFERAAQLRDRIRALKQKDLVALFASGPNPAEPAETAETGEAAISSPAVVAADPTPANSRARPRRKR